MRAMRPRSLTVRLALIALVAAASSALLSLLLVRWLQPWAACLFAVVAVAAPTAWWIRSTLQPARALFRALSGTVSSYRDGDFNFGIRWDHRDDLGELVAAHNALGDALREQRLALVQRELLLDTMVQNTPVAMLLVDPARRIVLANIAARHLLGEGRRLEGHALGDLLASTDPAVRDAFGRGGDGMFTVGNDDAEEIFHLARRSFRLNGRNHELLLLRRLTTELRRQEVQTWKKVIRVISHELNNSLAPIASLAHSSAELLRRGQHDRLPEALATIEERARHLEGFIRDYARFAKLPTPRLATVPWQRFIEQLRSQVAFNVELHPADGSVRCDAAQLEQALINLLKNAHESGCTPEQVRLSIRRIAEGWRIEVLDRGSGMNAAVLANALLPFYSTKRHGTGLGLALAREIAEAHGGRIALLNREGGGLCVSMVLPDR